MEQADILILLISFIGLALIFGGLYFFLATGDESEKSPAVKANTIENTKKKTGPRRRRVGADAPGQAVDSRAVEPVAERLEMRNENNDNMEDEGKEENDENENVIEEEDLSHLTKKELLKLEKKRMKQAERDQDDAQRTIKQEKQSKRDAIQQQKDLEFELAEKKQKEEEEELQLLKEVKEKEDYDEWKEMFSVEASGSEDIENKTKLDLLGEFINYIKQRKVVVLEDLAIDFGLPAAQCVTRVNTLEEMGQLSGVVDDRGKFIYVSPEELQAVANFVKRRGRVTISDLAIESNKLINLKEVVETAQSQLDEQSDEEDRIETMDRDNNVDTNAPQA